MQNAAACKQNRLLTLRKNVSQNIRRMLRADVIISHLMAITLCGFIAILLQFKWVFPYSAHLQHGFIIGIEILVAVQVIKSSGKSLLLPAACMLISAVGLLIQHLKLVHIPITDANLHAIMLVGIIGTCIAILNS